MKKALLSAVAIAATVMTGWANEYTFVFDGNNDMGGLTRQTSTKEADLTFTRTFTLSEEGIDLKVADNSETGLGFALVNAGGTNAGLCVYSTMSKKTIPEISLTVPGGKINSVKLVMSGLGLISLDIPFNGTVIESVQETPLYSWTWKDSAGAETVSFTWENAYNVRYIHSIAVEYTPDLGGKQECGLSFKATDYEAILGESFTSPTLTNPNKLEVSWSSSDEAVATVDAEGKVTLVGKGTTSIKAATEGNAEYAAGNAKYTLTVLPTAANIAELMKEAPALYDRVKVNFPVTVNYANLTFAYVTDAEGTATCIDNTSTRNSTSTSASTIYKVGEVIPAGWIATNATQYESVVWEGQPGKVTETVEVKYASVSSVTPADADRVVILKNVTFTDRTAEGYEKAYGTTPNGTRYEFQDTYGVGAKPAGTYDVTCVVRYSKRGTTEYFYLAPVAYAEPSGDVAEDPVFPESFDVKVSFEGAEISQGEEWDVYTIHVEGECPTDTYTVTVEVPEGWDGFIGSTDADEVGGIDPLMKKVSEPYWVSLEDMLGEDASLKEGNTLTFPADGEEHYGQLMLYKDGYVDVMNCLSIEVLVEKAGGSELPTFPEELKVTVNTGATVWQGALAEINEKTSAELTEDELEFAEQFQAQQALVITGKITEDNVTATFDLPEGWAGVQPILYKGFTMSDEYYRTRSNESEWVPMEEYLMNFMYMGAFDVTMEGGKQLTFPVNEKKVYFSYLYITDDGTLAGDPEFAGDFVDCANMFLIVVDVENEGSGVNGVEAAENAEYYNVNGVRVANPGKGLYIKVVDGKATKSIKY